MQDISYPAARLAVPKSWVYTKCEAGEFPHVRVGRYLRFETAAVEAWIAANRQAQR